MSGHELSIESDAHLRSGQRTLRTMSKIKTKQTMLVKTNESPDMYPGLTGLRGLAALWVLLLHVYSLAGSPDSMPAPLAWLSQMGWTGVDIFFTLSAFLLSLPYAHAIRAKHPAPATARYFKRRIARVVPAYYLQCLLLGILVAAGFAELVFWYPPSWQGWLAHAVLWINAWPLVPAYLPIWWTLPVELGFYLLLPLLAKCLTDKRWVWLLVGIALSLMYRYAVLAAGFSKEYEFYWADNLPGRLFQFLIGMLAAFFWVKWRAQNFFISKVSRNLIFGLSCAALIALPALGWLEGATYRGSPASEGLAAHYHLFASLLIAVIIVMLVSGRTLADGLLASWPMQWFGKISYGLYLWHYPVILLLRENMGGMSAVKSEFAVFFILSFLISSTLAFLSWHWLEAPILKRVGSSTA